MKLIRFITTEEFKKLLKAEKRKDYKLAYVLGFGSGLRISEVLGLEGKIKPLTKQQINLKEHQIRILGKGGKERITVTSPWLNEKNMKLLPLSIKRSTMQKHIRKLGKKVLGKSITFHVLRHGWANRLANDKNMPLPLLQTLGGWSRLDTVGIYTKANPKQAIKEAYERF